VENSLESLSKELERIEGYDAVMNLMNRYSHYMPRYQGEEIIAMFANLPDTKAEMLWGVYNGIEGIRRCFAFGNPLFTDQYGLQGELHPEPLASPLIVVAGDAKTAKGVWLVPTTFARKKRDGSGEVENGWRWFHYAADFIKIEGEWKFWHLHAYGRFQSPYDTSWAYVPPFDVFEVNGTTEEAYFSTQSEAIPDAPPSKSWGYSTDSIYPYDMPLVPEAYDTYEGSDWI